MPLPPGPVSWYHVLPNTLAVLKDPGALFRRLHAQHGDPFSLRAVNGRIAFTAEPEGVRQIFTAPPETFRVFAPKSLRPLLGEHSILTNDGATHLRARKLQIPSLHGALLRGLAEAMRACSEKRAAEAVQAGGLEAQDFGRTVALDVIFRAVFGVEDPALHERLRVALGVMTSSAHPLLIFIPPLQQTWLPPYRRYLERQVAFNELLREAVQRVEASAEEGQSVVATLLRARDEEGGKLTWPELRDHLVTLLVAGHETTAVALAWALYFIHRDPAVEDRLRAEIAAAETNPDPLAELPYLEAVCHEALRLHPVVTEVLRELAVPWEFCGHALPAGAGVGAAIWLAHRREEAFPNAEQFRPERFLERTFTPFEFIPFGGGQRRCLGSAFALMEMQIVLRTLLSRGRLRLRDRTFPGLARRHVTMAPKHGIELTWE